VETEQSDIVRRFSGLPSKQQSLTNLGDEVALLSRPYPYDRRRAALAPPAEVATGALIVPREGLKPAMVRVAMATRSQKPSPLNAREQPFACVVRGAIRTHTKRAPHAKVSARSVDQHVPKPRDRHFEGFTQSLQESLGITGAVADTRYNAPRKSSP